MTNVKTNMVIQSSIFSFVIGISYKLFRRSMNIDCFTRMVFIHVSTRVFDFRLYFFFASKRNEPNRDPFRMRFACSLRSFRFLLFAIFAYFRIKSFFVFALFRFINFLLNINCWTRVFSYIICPIFLECGTLRAMKN